MDASILAEIKEAEQNAEKIILQANIKKEQLLNESRKLAQKLLNEKKAEIHQELENEYNKKELELKKSAQNIIDKAEESASRLEKTSKKNMPSVITIILNEFERQINS